MQYMRLDDIQRDELIRSLEAMHTFLRDAFATLSADEARRPGPNGAFSPVEQAWHLADLEREGFGTRIRRLQAENDPVLPDFDGARIAQERDYKSLSLTAGIEAFDAARRANISTFRSMPADAWSRSGTQDGVGPVSLCDMPLFLRQHDQAHVAEIQEWHRFVAEQTADSTRGERQ